MKKVLAVVFLALAVLVQPCFSESLKKRISKVEVELYQLKQRIQEVEEIQDIMSGTTIPTDLEIDMDGTDPDVAGDIKIVKGTVTELDDCDATAQWSVHSGVGVTIAQETGIVAEGAGSIKVTIPASTTAIIKATKASGSWDISTHKYLKVWMKYGTHASLANCNMHFGEAAYSEQNRGTFSISYLGAYYSWDISAIAAASRNGVTIFAITLPNTDLVARTVYIDYVYADPGPSAIKAYDGDRVSILYPKVYQGTYTGNGSDPQTITIPRKGTPIAILLWGNVATYGHAHLWMSSMGSNLAKDLSAGGTGDAGVITTVGDCYFTVAGNYANKDTVVYHYLVWWAD